MNERRDRRIFLAWVNQSSRSDLIADTFNARKCYFQLFSNKSILSTIARYCAAAVYTFAVVARKRPKIVFVMNQPVFLPILIYVFSALYSYKFVIDSHSGIFNKRVWRFFLPVMKPVYRRALLNLSHNSHDAAIFQSWGSHTLLFSVELYADSVGTSSLKFVRERNIVVIAVYAADEPIEEVLEAARALENVGFYVTGSLRTARRRGISIVPENVVLTDFLPREAFLALVKAADGAMVLVKTDNTMQMGAWEAMSVGTPLILSDWKALRETFPKGAIFVKNEPGEIASGVRELLERRDVLKREIHEIRAEKRKFWNRSVEAVEQALLRAED